MTGWAAKKSGVVRFAVASQVTALAPFSQNSNEEVWQDRARRSRAVEPVRLVHGQQAAGFVDNTHLAANGVG